MKSPKSQQGFTLIETVIYAGLISIIIGFAVSMISQIIENQSRLRARVEVAEETNFILRKISWALAGVTAINQPPSGSSSTILGTTKSNFAENPLVFDLNGGNIRLSRASGTPAILNSGNILVKKLNFEHTAASGTIPEAVKTTITLESVSASSSETITTVDYLRKQL